MMLLTMTLVAIYVAYRVLGSMLSAVQALSRQILTKAQ